MADVSPSVRKSVSKRKESPTQPSPFRLLSVVQTRAASKLTMDLRHGSSALINATKSLFRLSPVTTKPCQTPVEMSKQRDDRNPDKACRPDFTGVARDPLSGQLSRSEFRYLAVTVPNAYLEHAVRQRFRDLGLVFLPIEVIVTDMLLTPRFDVDCVFEWVRFLVREDPREQFSRDTLVYLALIGDTRLADVLGEQLAQGRICAEAFVEAIELIGAIRMLRNDAIGCRVLWKQCLELRREASDRRSMLRQNSGAVTEPVRPCSRHGRPHTDEQMISALVRVLDGDNVLPADLLIEALHIFRHAVDGRTCEDRLIAYLRSLTKLGIATAKQLATSARHCFDFLSQLVAASYFCNDGCNEGIVHFIEFAQDRIWLWDGVLMRLEVEQAIDIVLDLEFNHAEHRGQCRRCNSVYEGFVSTILSMKFDVGQIADAGIESEKLGRLLYGLLKLATRSSRFEDGYVSIVKALIDQGASSPASEWHEPILRLALENRTLPSASAVLEAQPI